MTADGSISDSAQPARASRKRVALRWGLWGVLSMPPTVLLHELGHFLVFWGLGFPGAALHYGSAGYSGSGDFSRAVMEGRPGRRRGSRPRLGGSDGDRDGPCGYLSGLCSPAAGCARSGRPIPCL